MKKQVKVQLENDEGKSSFIVPCIYDIKKLCITYVEKDELNTIVKLDLKNWILSRKNKDIRLRFPYRMGDETVGQYEVYDINKIIELKINTTKLERKDNNIFIEYYIENQKFKYYLEVI